MSILKYYISTEYPVELSNELKDHVSIYSKRKSNNKLIILKELDYININIRNLLKNNFVYEVEFEKTNTYLQEKVIELINKIIKCNIFNGFNAIEIYCNEDNDLEKVNLKIKDVDENIFFEKTSAPEPIHLMTEVTSILGSIRKMPIFRTRSDCAWYPATIDT